MRGCTERAGCDPPGVRLANLYVLEVRNMIAKKAENMSKDKTPTQVQTKDAKQRKPRTADTRPPQVIFGTRFNDELRQMNRRYDNLLSLANARKAHGTPEQVEAGIKWMEQRLAEVAAALRASIQPREESQGTDGKPAPFTVVPVDVPTPAQGGTAPAKA